MYADRNSIHYIRIQIVTMHICGVTPLLQICSMLRAPCSVLRAPCSVFCAPCFVLRAPCSILRAPCSVLRAPRAYVLRVHACSACVRGNLWELMGSRGNLRKTHGNLWELMGTSCVGIYRNFVRGNLWELMGTYYVHAWLMRAWFVRCRVLQYITALRDVFTLRFCAARCFYTAFSHCKVFLYYVFTLRVVFTLRFHAARRFYIVLSRCAVFLHYIFALQGVLLVVFFRCKAFLHCVFAIRDVFTICCNAAMRFHTAVLHCVMF